MYTYFIIYGVISGIQLCMKFGSLDVSRTVNKTVVRMKTIIVKVQ